MIQFFLIMTYGCCLPYSGTQILLPSPDQGTYFFFYHYFKETGYRWGILAIFFRRETTLMTLCSWLPDYLPAHQDPLEKGSFLKWNTGSSRDNSFLLRVGKKNIFERAVSIASVFTSLKKKNEILNYSTLLKFCKYNMHNVPVLRGHLEKQSS